MRAYYYYNPAVTKTDDTYSVSVFMRVFGRNILMGNVSGESYPEVMDTVRGTVKNLYELYPRVSIFTYMVESIREKYGYRNNI